MNQQIVLLDAANVAIRNIDAHRAMKFIFAGLGESILDSTKFLHASQMDIPIPSIVRLNTPRPVCYKYLYSPLRWSKNGVMRRDRFECAYCGAYASTIDHVHPKSKGGQNSWMNTVACCYKCNSEKGNSLLSDIGMELRFDPFVPARSDLIMFDARQSDFLTSMGMESMTKRKGKRRALVA